MQNRTPTVAAPEYPRAELFEVETISSVGAIVVGAATFLHRVAPRFGAAQSFDEHGVLRFTSWACCQAAARERRGRRVATRREPLLRGGRRILTATLHLYAIPHRARVLKGPAPPCEGRFVSPNESAARLALKPDP